MPIQRLRQGRIRQAGYKKDNTTEEFIDEKIVDAVKKAAFRCDTLIDDEGLARIVSEVRSRLEGRDEVSVLELHELVIAVLSAQQHKQVVQHSTLNIQHSTLNI